ncbi:MAG: citrate/2-methylcitrate synthase [Clostridia bacterium]|nr:citrate/2-methylcitrate synthase [Clostridia bacterium]
MTDREIIEKVQAFFKHVSDLYQPFPKGLFKQYGVKRGLRNEDETGVMVGLTSVGQVIGYRFEDGNKIPIEGHLEYRGYDINDIVKSCERDGRFGFEEVVFLLLCGKLPSEVMLDRFNKLMGECRPLPEGFTEDMILKAPSSNIMNKLGRSVLTLYSYDDNPDEISVANIMRQSIRLISSLSVIAAYGYQAKRHYYDGESLHLHHPQPELSTAENLLFMLRPDNQFTRDEAETLDVLMMVQAEHGGGNNSAFTTRVVSSSGTDTYSAIAAAIGSLKGPKHGGANAKVMGMMEDIKSHVKDWADEDEVKAYIEKILKKDAYDRTGLVYGMGHAIYTLSDPRCVLLKERAARLAAKNPEWDKEFKLYNTVEKLTPECFYRIKNSKKYMCANVDMYSGFVYKMLDIAPEMYTPIFAISRIPGWCAHRLEETIGCSRIIRPAYKSIVDSKEYIPLQER